MGIRKEIYYSKKELEIATIAKGMAHPARKKILSLFRQTGAIKKSDLARLLELSLPTVKEHLDFMVEAKLIKMKYDVHYHRVELNGVGIKKLKGFLEELESEIF